jgi:hypothetical protein
MLIKTFSNQIATKRIGIDGNDANAVHRLYHGYGLYFIDVKNADAFVTLPEPKLGAAIMVANVGEKNLNVGYIDEARNGTQLGGASVNPDSTDVQYEVAFFISDGSVWFVAGQMLWKAASHDAKYDEVEA